MRNRILGCLLLSVTVGCGAEPDSSSEQPEAQNVIEQELNVQGTATYRRFKLPPNSAGCEIFDKGQINQAGEMVAFCYIENEEPATYVWSGIDAEPVPLLPPAGPLPAAGWGIIATAINDHGVIAGQFISYEDGYSTLVRWRKKHAHKWGRAERLTNTDVDGYTDVHAINDKGDIVGEYQPRPVDGVYSYGGFLWHDGDLEGLAMGPDSLGYWRSIKGINEHGLIALNFPIDGPDGYLIEGARVYDNDAVVALPRPDGVFEAQAQGLNDRGVVIGMTPSVWNPEVNHRGLRWTKHAGSWRVEYLRAAYPDALASNDYPMAINKHGNIAGKAYPIDGSGTEVGHLVVWKKHGGLIDYGAAPAPYTNFQGISVDVATFLDDGSIFATVYEVDPTDSFFIYQPVLITPN